jgi:aromatic ring hydroxylase
VFLDGERLDDASTHPVFTEPLRRIAETYDVRGLPRLRDATTFVDPDTGQRHSNMWLVPRASADLVARRRAHRLWAEASYGLMGRTPDHVALRADGLRIVASAV